MKRILLLAGIAMTSITSVYAQPVLTASTNNPVPGDVFYGRQCDTTGVAPGAAGASATWNFSGLVTTWLDTTSYSSCLPALSCDSFPGSNLVAYNNPTYVYANAGTSALSILGYNESTLYTQFATGRDVIYFPLTYNSTHKDTSDVNYFGYDYQHVEDSFTYDAYGTLVLPSGTFTNTVRVHNVSVSKDSTFTGTSWDVSVSSIDEYIWYVSGFHNPLLNITTDTANGNSVEYYTIGLPLAVNNITKAPVNMDVYPNPANDHINLKFSLTNTKDASIAVCDLTGVVVAKVSSDKMNSGMNDITVPVSGLPAGMYIVHLKSPEGNISKKVVIAR